MRFIADTGAVFALLDKDDKWHNACKNCFTKLNLELILPATTIPEICYLANKHLGQNVENAFIKSITDGELKVEDLKVDDYHVALYYLKKFSDLNIGFVDSTVISIAKRLQIYDLFTVDRRYFSQIKTKEGKTFNLIPESSD
ncbi:MAG: type II toxin-antitoxin system VapC family toxin [Thermodesulfobacteriota bacterium]